MQSQTHHPEEGAVDSKAKAKLRRAIPWLCVFVAGITVVYSLHLVVAPASLRAAVPSANVRQVSLDTTSATNAVQHWHCGVLQGTTSDVNMDAAKPEADGFHSGTSIRINVATKQVEVFMDDETAESHEGTEAHLFNRDDGTISWFEITKGPAPSVGLYTLFIPEGWVYYANQRRQVLTKQPGASSFRAHCNLQG